ncbi:MAG TPA: alanine racemase C-terminal domain-containing protein, partial [Dehalococcoidia bacterium]|nr:alanine racemase C-terminal domain-containing protein [Dehalococcoidia bacterium]
RGQRVPITGRVCMDMTMIDVTDIPDVIEGDEVTIIGKQGRDAISVQEIAQLANIVSYEVLCGIGSRVPRVYRGGSQEAAQMPIPSPQGSTLSHKVS